MDAACASVVLMSPFRGGEKNKIFITKNTRGKKLYNANPPLRSATGRKTRPLVHGVTTVRRVSPGGARARGGVGRGGGAYGADTWRRRQTGNARRTRTHASVASQERILRVAATESRSSSSSSSSRQSVSQSTVRHAVVSIRENVRQRSRASLSLSLFNFVCVCLSRSVCVCSSVRSLVVQRILLESRLSEYY